MDPEAQRRELLVIRLRLRQGVEMNKFTHQYGMLDSATQAVIHRLMNEDYLQWHQGSLQLTERGILFYETVATVSLCC